MTAVFAAPSLRSRLLRHVLLPLALTWLLGSALGIWQAHYFVRQAFDRALLDDAHALAASVRPTQGRLVLELTPAEIKTVLFDQVENVYFAVLDGDGRLIAGHPGLRAERLSPGLSHGLAEQAYDGHWLRTVTLRRAGGTFTVVLGQTTRSQGLLLQRLAVFSAMPPLVLLVLLAAWLRRAIQTDLAPLTELEEALDQRDAQDLRPVTVPASTRDLQRLTRAVNALLARVAQSVTAQRQFAGNVAHELRTPLAGIRAQAEYGLAQPDPATWRAQLEGVARSEARASHLVDQLLALALADEARADMVPAPVPLEPLVREAVLRFLPRADAAGVDLGAHGLEPQLVVRGHAGLIEGVLNNLIDNALRYGRPADAPARITVAVGQGAAGVTLSVCDNGPGIAPRERRQLMQRWAQGALGERLGQGTGLGLAIVAQYARVMGVPLSLGPGEGGVGLCASLRFEVVAPPAV